MKSTEVREGITRVLVRKEKVCVRMTMGEKLRQITGSMYDKHRRFTIICVCVDNILKYYRLQKFVGKKNTLQIVYGI